MTNETRQLFHFVIRLNKEDSAFFYFQLEANDGLAFYSTKEYPEHAQYRDIDLKGDIKLKSEIEHLLDYCSQRFPVQILVNEELNDQRSEK